MKIEIGKNLARTLRHKASSKDEIVVAAMFPGAHAPEGSCTGNAVDVK